VLTEFFLSEEKNEDPATIRREGVRNNLASMCLFKISSIDWISHIQYKSWTRHGADVTQKKMQGLSLDTSSKATRPNKWRVKTIVWDAMPVYKQMESLQFVKRSKFWAFRRSCELLLFIQTMKQFIVWLRVVPYI
jgi:hypothetical protein